MKQKHPYLFPETSPRHWTSSPKPYNKTTWTPDELAMFREKSVERMHDAAAKRVKRKFRNMSKQK